MSKLKSLLIQLLNVLGLSTAFKYLMEWRYWKKKHLEEPNGMSNIHYEYFYTDYFGLSGEYYKNKAILDIGCGPRGSLEWAGMTQKRVGLDPLANKYLTLGADKHGMEYVQAYSENIPFANETFDVVCSFNSIDHVDDMKKTCAEIKRVLKPGGFFLLITDLHENPTLCEPYPIKKDFVEEYFGDMETRQLFYGEKTENGIYQSLNKPVAFDFSNTTTRYGILTAKLLKK